jgi:hypothetical protein
MQPHPSLPKIVIEQCDRGNFGIAIVAEQLPQQSITTVSGTQDQGWFPTRLSAENNATLTEPPYRETSSTKYKDGDYPVEDKDGPRQSRERAE